MTRKIALVGALALAMSLTAGLSAARNASGDKSTGGVGFSTASGFAAEASFNAHETPDPNADAPAKGRVNVRGHGPADFKGDVDCYFRVDDNTATFSGMITEITGALDTHFRIMVQDNGNPGSRGPDLIRVQRAMSALDCEEGDPPNRPVERGNLKVHH